LKVAANGGAVCVNFGSGFLDDAFHGKKDTKRWPERLSIARTSCEKVEGTDRYAFIVGFKVSAESPSPLNRGRNTRGYYLYNPKASGEDKDAFMSKITLSRLDSLLRAIGYEFGPRESPDFGALFSDPDSPLLGREVNAVLSDRPDNQDPTIRRQEIGSFSQVSDG
jgi:hypothetical protein